MIIRIKCQSCGEELEIAHSQITPLGDVDIEIFSCENIDCYNCRECEIETELKELKEFIKDMKT